MGKFLFTYIAFGEAEEGRRDQSNEDTWREKIKKKRASC